MADFFAGLPMAEDNESPCGYFDGRKTSQLVTMTSWLKDFYGKEFPEKQYYSYLLENGSRRYSPVFYLQNCKECKECTPIRISVADFKPSKSQRHVWRKNQDLRVKVITHDVKQTPEKAFLFREYDAYHNGLKKVYEKLTIDEALEQLKQMNSGYEGIWNMEYYLGERLIAVGIIDYTENSEGKIDALSSNYFYYDVSPDILKRSIGVFSVLMEIDLCKQLEVPYYYLGLYLPNCRKMNYKAKYVPFELFQNGEWVKYEKEGVPASIKQSLTYYTLPEPGTIYPDYPDISFASSDIPLDVLYSGYLQGIFPWFNEDEGEPVIWRSPNPRFVIPIEQLHVSKSLKKFLKHNPYTYTMDTCFERVMSECGKMEREGQIGSWIGPKMLAAYKDFHKAGYVHSFEVWDGDELAGGFYGVLLGSIFIGESMFTKKDNSSKSAFVIFAKAFAACGGKMIDCQAYTDNMARYGAIEIPREDYLKELLKLVEIPLKGDIKTEFLKAASQQ